MYIYIRGPKLGTYSDWGLSSVLVINKHLSHHLSTVDQLLLLYNHTPINLLSHCYGVASVSRINKITSPFCKRDP